MSIELQLCCSPSLRRLIFSAHLVAGLGCLFAALPFWVKSLLLLLVGSSLVRVLYVEKRVLKPKALTLSTSGTVDVIDAYGNSERCSVLPSSTVFHWFIVLRLARPESLLTFVLPHDGLVGDGHRQLRRWLRWQARIDAV